MRTARSEARRARLHALFFLVVAALVMLVLWHWLKPVAKPPVPAAAVVEASQDIDWVVRDGHRVSGPELITASAGETLRLRVRSNRADELHIHGYEVSRDLPADHLVVVELPLALSGRFDIELHGAHQVLAVLEVQPR